MKSIGFLAVTVTLFNCNAFAFPDVGVNGPNGIASLSSYGSAQRGGRDDKSGGLRSRSINNFANSQDSTGSNNIFQDGPLTFNDKEAIIFPDKLEEVRQLGFAKDSYGNPVTPFALSQDDVSSRNGAIAGNDANIKKDENGFILPSYASGIIGFVDPNLPIPKLNLNLEPPLSSGNFYYPGVNSETSTEFIKVSDIILSTSTPQAKPSVDLLPPLETTNFNSNFFNQPQKPSITSVDAPAADLLPPLEKQPDLNNRFEGVNSEPKPKPTAPVRPTPPAIQIPVFVQTPPKKATEQTVQKYTGGFGGAPGLLSPLQQSSSVVQQPQQPNKLPLVQAPSVQQTTVFQQPIPNRFDDKGNKYTGGFGGPPGLLTPFDNINEYARINTNN